MRVGILSDLVGTKCRYIRFRKGNPIFRIININSDEDIEEEAEGFEDSTIQNPSSVGLRLYYHGAPYRMKNPRDL